MQRQICRDMVMGRAILPKEALDHSVLSSIYTNEEQAERQIQAFAKEFAPRATNRKVLKEIKLKLHKEAVKMCHSSAFTPAEV